MNKIFNGYCLIFQSEISEGLCVEIIHELTGLKKEEQLKQIKNYILKGIANDELKKICKKCSNSPEELKCYEK